MFELNLIKDKALARQRRRVIFLAVACILLLAGLVSIFVGSLIWNEHNRVKTLRSQVASLESENKTREEGLNLREPKARTLRNGMIKAWAESYKVRKDRPQLTPLMQDLADRRPMGVNEFWYNQVSIKTIKQGNTPAEQILTGDDLLGFRALEGFGYVQIAGSDVLTGKALEQLGSSFSGAIKVVGQPSYELLLEQESQAKTSSASESTRYVRFSVQAAQRTFTGGRGAGAP